MIYSGTLLSKTDDKIPLFNDGKPMHSRYNPFGEAASFANNIETGFIIVAGIGGGFHLEALLQKVHDDFFILAVEEDAESLSFCLNLETNKRIFSNPCIESCTVADLENSLSKYYYPAAYPEISFITQRAWENHNLDSCKKIKTAIENKLSESSADFSVQSHFGKIWQRNILSNIKKIKKMTFPVFDINKTAAVIAAGPSLDRTVKELKDARSSYVIFSTDTAYGTLIKNNIYPEYVVSIDGQFVSTSHFYINNDDSGTAKTLFVFDMCANPNAVRTILEHGKEIIFTKSLHPLCDAILGNNNLATLQSGSGTVTIAACDLARQLGAKKIRVFGADFSYNSGKPYCKGTYLDNNFSNDSNRFLNLETQYTSLMYRTELYDSDKKNIFGDKLENPKSSSILNGYKKTFLEWIQNNDYKLADNIFINEENCIAVSETGVSEEKLGIWKKDFEKLLEDEKIIKNASSLLKNAIIFPLLPYVAWYRKKNGYNKRSLFDLLKLAYTRLSRYTERYEK